MLLPADEIHISGVRWNMEFSGRDQSSALSLRCCANSTKMKTFCTGPMQQSDFQISSWIKIAQITKKEVDKNAGKKVILKNWESNHIKSKPPTYDLCNIFGKISRSNKTWMMPAERQRLLFMKKMKIMIDFYSKTDNTARMHKSNGLCLPRIWNVMAIVKTKKNHFLCDYN